MLFSSSRSIRSMSKNSVEDKLKDLNLSNDELKRFSDAFQNEEFRKLFLEYAEEINDPTNRQLYEDEIRAVEEQRGSDVTFVHPKPGHVLKTTLNGKNKCFINIATNEHVDKPSYAKTAGTNGVNWSLPHCLAGPHEDLDHDSKPCTVYDVIFSPDTYRMAETNAKFMKMIEDSAVESVEKNYHCQLDRNNLKRIKMKFKGVAKATIIRRKKDDHHPLPNTTESKSDDPIDQVMSNAQNHKVVLTSHNRSVDHPPIMNSKPTLHTDENGYTIPIYRLVHRGEYDMQDCTNSIVAQVRSMRPKELLVEVDLPLCASTNNVDLDVCERSLKLHCDSPKYSLDLSLPYPVRESDSHARFDKKQRKLLITLSVIKETPTVIEIDSDAEMDEPSEPISTAMIPEPTMMMTNPIADDVPYSFIPFEYKQGLARVALVLYVKNVDQKSFKLDNDGQYLTIQLISFGSGCFPLHHQLCLDFDQSDLFETAESASNITFNDDNVLILLKKTANNKTITQFSSGVTRDDMKVEIS